MKTKSQFTLFRWDGKRQKNFNHVMIWGFIPSIKFTEDLDYESHEVGLRDFQIEALTFFRIAYDRDFWTVSLRVLGFGFTINRQKPL